MNKYTSLTDDVYSIFGNPLWKAEGILTIPDNYAGTGEEYIRVSIVASEFLNMNAPRSCSGQLLIDIFTPAGVGLKRATTIADRLDSYLAGQNIGTSMSGRTQFVTSAFSPKGNDRANPGLYRSLYVIPFKYYGN